MSGGRADLVEPVLRRVWGFAGLRPRQEEVVAAWAEGRDVVALLPTGAGKSLCYQLPALIERQLGGGTTLVVSPLIALMQDQVDSLAARGVKAAALNSHQSPEAQEQIEDAADAGLLDLLFVSPERAASPRFRELVGGLEVALVAIDEAHCVSQWGHDFRPEYLQLGRLRQSIDAPLMAVTATATPRVVDEIAAHLAMREPAIVRGDFARPNLRFSVVHERGAEARVERLVAELDGRGFRDAGGSGRAIVYCASRKKVESVAAALRQRGIFAGCYHAGRPQAERAKTQRGFELGRTRVLVATNAFGMGIDLPDVRLVAHLQCPGSLEAYYQEAGRAGRDGLPSDCLLFFSEGDLVLQRRLAGGAARGVSDALDAVRAYAAAAQCRQRTLCEHFAGPHERGDCGLCDVCVDPEAAAAAVDAPREVTPLEAAELELIVRAVGNLRRPVGARGLARALRGSRARELRKHGLLSLPEHGALAGRDEASIAAAIDGLLRAGRLARRGRKYPTVWLPDRPVRRSATAEGGGSKAGAAGRSRTRRSGSNLARALELYRRRTARALGVKPFMVMHSKAIAELDQQRPKTLLALEAIHGLGPAKIERFGAELLDIVRRYDEQRYG